VKNAMKRHSKDIKKHIKQEKGFSLVEILIVFLIIAILVVLGLPQIMSSQRLLRFSGIQRQLTTTLREARQEAMGQRAPITVRYDNVNKRIIVYGGKFGAESSQNNQIIWLSSEGVEADDIVYGKPAGASMAALSDGTNLEVLTGGFTEITFQADGAVIDASENTVNKAWFFYHEKAPGQTAFALSVLGAGGRVKVWRYSEGANVYIE
jgi:prepilin-type N-terminal cleavage/methylation domain-containing protein